MTIGTKEFYCMMEKFEKIFYYMRLDKEPEEYWSEGIIYQDGEINKLYSAFSYGYSFARAVYLDLDHENVMQRKQQPLLSKYDTGLVVMPYAE